MSADRLTEARNRSGYTQDQVADALGVSRVMLSYWESGKRRPNDLQLVALARLYGQTVADLLSEEPLVEHQPAAQMMFRGAGGRLPEEAQRGLREFEGFLDTYADLARELRFKVRGMQQSPFTVTDSYASADDARRKAEEVRAHLRIGIGPIGEMDRVCELLGVTILRAPLGQDLDRTISGAYFNHPEIGFSLLVNVEMTPGRRRFTVAHELAHALFHSDQPYVLSFARKDPKERFADLFAGEFLMPTEGVRRVMEEQGFGPHITDPADVIHLQRYFNVSYATALVRLRQARILTQDMYLEFQDIRPVVFARALGYETDPDEYQQDPNGWGLRRFPPRFLRMLRSAIRDDHISASTAAELVGVSVAEMADFAANGPTTDEESSLVRRELGEFEQTGVT